MTHDGERNPQDADAPRGGDRGSTGASADLAGIGLQFALTVVVFVLGGIWLDRRFGTSPWLLIVSVLVGAGGGMYSMYRRATAAMGRGQGRSRR